MSNSRSEAERVTHLYKRFVRFAHSRLYRGYRPLRNENDGKVFDEKPVRFDVHFCSYKTEKWVRSNVVVRSTSIPGVSVCDKYLFLAYHIQGGTVRCEVYRASDFELVFDWFAHFDDVIGGLRCTIGDHGWMAVSNGKQIFHAIIQGERAYEYRIKERLVSSIHLANEGELLLCGTYDGQIYHIQAGEQEMVRPNYTLSALPVFGLVANSHTIFAHGIYDTAAFHGGDSLTKLDKHDHSNLARPISLAISKGTLTVVLDKYGYTKLRSLLYPEECKLDLRPPQGVKCHLEWITMWFENGVYFDGHRLVSFLPEGTIVIRTLK